MAVVGVASDDDFAAGRHGHCIAVVLTAEAGRQHSGSQTPRLKVAEGRVELARGGEPRNGKVPVVVAEGELLVGTCDDDPTIALNCQGMGFAWAASKVDFGLSMMAEREIERAVCVVARDDGVAVIAEEIDGGEVVSRSGYDDLAVALDSDGRRFVTHVPAKV